jgi:hypothetical protein
MRIPRSRSPIRSLPALLPATHRVRRGAVVLAVAALLPSLRALSNTALLADAPEPQLKTQTGERMTAPGPDNRFLGAHVGPSYPLTAGKFNTIIHPGQHAPGLSAADKLVYAAREQGRWFIMVPALITTGYGHAADSDPHAGSDGAGFGERLGLTMARQATDRFSGDGLYAALFRQDPRYYREGNGPLVHRGLRAVRQTFVRRGDSGADRTNVSGILGHLTASLLAMTYYPHESANIRASMQGFGTAVAGDMGSKLVLEFGPDALRLIFFRNKR